MKKDSGRDGITLAIGMVSKHRSHAGGATFLWRTGTMRTLIKPLLALTASDLMTPDVLYLPQTMPLPEAIRLLLDNHVSGAPVVDDRGRCVGIFSAVDIARFAGQGGATSGHAHLRLPKSCSFFTKQKDPEGKTVAYCTLPLGACPIQRCEKDAEGTAKVVCSQPNCVLADWQVVEMEELPHEDIGRFMTSDVVMVTPDTPIRQLARQMIDAHIHRVLVGDEQRRPVGIVSSTDVLAAVAYAAEAPVGDEGSVATGE
jgi:CBS domain-containing protein